MEDQLMQMDLVSRLIVIGGAWISAFVIVRVGRKFGGKDES